MNMYLYILWHDLIQDTDIHIFSHSQILLVPQGVGLEGEISDKHVFTKVGQRLLVFLLM